MFTWDMNLTTHKKMLLLVLNYIFHQGNFSTLCMTPSLTFILALLPYYLFWKLPLGQSSYVAITWTSSTDDVHNARLLQTFSNIGEMLKYFEYFECLLDTRIECKRVIYFINHKLWRMQAFETYVTISMTNGRNNHRISYDQTNQHQICFYQDQISHKHFDKLYTFLFI